MDLTFTNNSSEFRAESHFNLHLENAGRAKLYKRTSLIKWWKDKTILAIYGVIALAGLVNGELKIIDYGMNNDLVKECFE